MMRDDKKPRILVVDDNERNILLLRTIMEGDGYEVDEALNGLEAIEKITKFSPNLILLDIMMPEMDGFEVLKTLKANEDTRYIPIFLLSARSDIEDKMTGLELGAEDYITKPFNPLEVSARVKSLLEMRRLQSKLRETEKLAALGEMVDGIAHEIRNPLVQAGGLARRLYEHETDKERKGYAVRIIDAIERMELMVKRVDEYKEILVTKIGDGDLNEIIEEACNLIKAKLTDKGRVELKKELAPQIPTLKADKNNLTLAIYNIIENALESIEEESDGEIHITSSYDATLGAATVTVKDNGGGIKESEVKEIFYPFQTTKMTGAGLGLAISQRIITDHGGKIEVLSECGEGSSFTITLPLVAKEVVTP